MTEAEAKKILGVNEPLTADVLKKCYRKKVLEYHPDKNPSGDNTMFILIQKAYQFLDYNLNNPAYSANQHQHSYYQDIYRARREAETAYKSRVKYYYVRRKKTRKQATEEIKSDFLLNLKYFAFTFLLLFGLLIGFFISLVFGLLGFIGYIGIVYLLFRRLSSQNFKL